MINIPGYTIHNQLGVGGMATVYRATQDSLQRDVALKVMSNLDDKKVNFKERFIHEGHDLASLQHPNIATIHDISQTDEHNYYAMELLSGGSLTDKQSQGLSLQEAFDIIIQIGGALECAHQNYIVHRDLKPSNILFRDESTPILTDFGIAKNIARDDQLTKTGSLLGTPAYMSPEQCRGLPIDGRSDQYSLCILFFELITGYLPFDADDSIAVAMQQITAPIPELPEHLAAIQPVINIAMDKDMAQRFTSVAEFCRNLDDLITHDTSLQTFRAHITQKLPDDKISDTKMRRPVQAPNSPADNPGAKLRLATEDDFWKEESSTRKWLLIALLLSCLGFAGNYFFHHYQRAQIAQEIENKRLVSLLLQKAKKQISLTQLTLPRGNNAYESLVKIMRMDPQNPTAEEMLDEVATIFEQRARKYLEDKDFENATIEISKGFKFSKSHQGLLSAQQMLNTSRN